MTAVTDFLNHSPVLFILLSAIDNLLAVAGCAMFAKGLLHLKFRGNPLCYIMAAALCIGYGAVIPGTVNESLDLLLSAVGMVYPFLCMLLLFRGKGRLKSLLAPFGYILVDGIRYLIVLFVFRFDYTVRDNAAELLVGLAVDFLFFLSAYLVLSIRTRRNGGDPDVSKTGVIMFSLIILSAAVLVTSLLLVGSARFEIYRAEFIFILLNIPVLFGTLLFAVLRLRSMKTEADQYKRQLQMQIRQFEWMEKMVEDVRIFRHDLPKKMRPLVKMLEDERTEEAKALASHLSDFSLQAGERFHTGNYYLDTVLFCEEQIAEREGVELDIPANTVFPKEGISADDIYTIFPNALDNAIEACKDCDGEKKVEFRSRFDKQTVFVTIRNPVKGEVKTKNGLPVSEKTDKTVHGYGFRSIKKAAAKYGKDNVSFFVGGGRFELRIFLEYAGKK